MKKEGTVLVCVTDQKNCERLIKAGHRLAQSENLALEVLSVQGGNRIKDIHGTPLEFFFTLCKALNAEMKVYWSDNTSKAAIDYIHNRDVRHLVVGETEKMAVGSFVYEVHQAFRDIPISVVNRQNITAVFDFDMGQGKNKI